MSEKSIAIAGAGMAGQWTAPFTRTVLAALTGRQVVHLLCRQDRKRFGVVRPQPICRLRGPAGVSVPGSGRGQAWH